MVNGGHLVFFSGGEDSTLVAIRLLRERKFVTLIVFDNCWVGGQHQQNLEKMHRKQIIQKMIMDFGQKSFTVKIITWDGDLVAPHQDELWVTLFPNVCSDGDIAYYGNCRIDDFWHDRTNFEETFQQICKYQKKKVELKYPLEWMFKKAIKKELKKYGYLDLVIHSGDKL